MKYSCKHCEYNTDNKYRYERHLSTKRHKKNVTTYVTVNNKFICKICNKSFSIKNKSRHMKLCEAEQCKIELENLKKKMVEILLKQNEAYCTRPIINNIDNSVTNNNIFNCKSYNFIINNYTNAYNIEDLMEPDLTVAEKKMLNEKGHILGYIDFIKQRCIDDIELDKRAFHCLDTSRNKYILHTKGKWQIDQDGFDLIQSTYPKIKGHFLPDKCKDINVIINENIRLGEFYRTRDKTLRDISRMCSLSNNIMKTIN
jgi:hypothetical protein